MTDPRWTDAQRAERTYHTAEVDGWPSVAARRAEDARLQAWYAGMLDIPFAGEPPKRTVTDFGCGPASLLLRARGWSEAVAVDPLTFAPEDERAYWLAGITRVVGTAEAYDGPQTDEAWCYNCLQHVQDWAVALGAVCRTARQTVRLFEWVGEPVTDVHLHTLDTDALRGVLAAHGFTERFRVDGTAARVGTWAQAFYSGVWERAQ